MACKRMLSCKAVAETLSFGCVALFYVASDFFLIETCDKLLLFLLLLLLLLVVIELR